MKVSESTLLECSNGRYTASETNPFRVDGVPQNVIASAIGKRERSRARKSCNARKVHTREREGSNGRRQGVSESALPRPRRPTGW
ncbi:unnamed protein product, partial [Iphiclides podalirius]